MEIPSMREREIVSPCWIWERVYSRVFGLRDRKEFTSWSLDRSVVNALPAVGRGVSVVPVVEWKSR